MPGHKTPDTAPGSQYSLPFGQGRGEPVPPKDPVQERVDHQVESGFAQSAARYGITVEQVRIVQDALGTESPKAFELIRGGMSPSEAIAKVKPEK